MFGTVRTLPDGRVEPRFERWFPHSRDKVWRALTSADELRAWFVEILDYDRSELTEKDDGCQLVFINTLTDGAPVTAVDEGWHLGLKRLADALDL